MSVPSADVAAVAESAPLTRWAVTKRVYAAARDETRQRWRGLALGLAVLGGILIWLHRWDHGLGQWVTNHRTAGYEQLSRQLSHWGEMHALPLILILILAGLGKWTGRRALSWAAAGGFYGTVTAGLSALVFKMIFGRPRPRLELPDGFYGFTAHYEMHSFPSGHSMHWAGLAMGLVFLAPRTGAVAVLLSLVVAASRVCLGAHYLTDVTAGLVVGGMIGGLIGLGCRRVARQAGGLA